MVINTIDMYINSDEGNCEELFTTSLEFSGNENNEQRFLFTNINVMDIHKPENSKATYAIAESSSLH